MNTFTDKDDKKLKELYADVFNGIHASDELKRKVTNMDTSTKKKGIRTAAKVLCTAAALAVFLVAGNMIAYAATGETLIHLVINGYDYALAADTAVDDDGNVYYFTSTDTDGFNTITYYFIDESGEATDTDIYIDSFTIDVIEESGHTYLEIAESERIDVTDDLADDGCAEGTFTYNGEEYCYETNGLDISYYSADELEDVEDNALADGEEDETTIFSSTVEVEE